MISDSVRDFLIAHLDGAPVPIDNSTNLRARASCLGLGLIVRLQTGPKSRGRRRILYPTVITEKGRKVLASALSDWAEAAARVERAKDEIVMSALLDADTQNQLPQDDTAPEKARSDA